MEYFLVYANGDSAYLTHSGVKGMKWGVWNSETRARYAGDKGSAKFNKDMSKLDKLETRRAKYAGETKALNREINASSKSAENQLRLAEYERKASLNKKRSAKPYFTEFGKARRNRQMRKAMRYDAKAAMIRSGNAKQQNKLVTWQRKQLKTEDKIKRLSSKIEREYTKAQVSSVTDKQKRLGQKYLHGILG